MSELSLLRIIDLTSVFVAFEYEKIIPSLPLDPVVILVGLVDPSEAVGP